MMKILISFLFSVGLVFAEGGTKGDVDMDNLFKQLDSVISAKKDKEKIDTSKQTHQSNATLKREKNYIEFNERAKKYHIFRAKKIINTVKNLQKEYGKKATDKVVVQRYSAIGDRKFAYVSSIELKDTIKRLQENGKVIKKLDNFHKLLSNIEEFDIKTISKVLIIVEQEVMNLRDMGVKKIQLSDKKQNADTPVLLKSNKRIENITVVSINEELATLEVNPF